MALDLTGERLRVDSVFKSFAIVARGLVWPEYPYDRDVIWGLGRKNTPRDSALHGVARTGLASRFAATNRPPRLRAAGHPLVREPVRIKRRVGGLATTGA